MIYSNMSSIRPFKGAVEPEPAAAVPGEWPGPALEGFSQPAGIVVPW
jgi:hypothetical protein